MFWLYLRAFLVTLFCFSIGIFGGVVVANEFKPSNVDPYDGFYTFSLNLHRIQNEYIEEVPTKTLIYHALSGMMEALDEPSHYFPPEEYQKLKAIRDTWSVGAGIDVNDSKIITSLVPHGPASIAGLMVGDQFTKLNGQSVEKWTISNLNAVLRQKKGDIVQVEVLRNQELLSTHITLDDVPTINLTLTPIQPGYIYVQMDRFSGDSAEELKQKLLSIQKNEGQDLKGILLDFRNNPGGNVVEGVKVADLFLEEGLITTVEYRDSSKNQQFEATPSDDDFSLPKLAILINQNTASSAELVAGALQFHKRATLIGQPSYGKGSVQKLYSSEDEALKLTVGRFKIGEAVLSKETPLLPNIPVAIDEFNPKKQLEEQIRSSRLNGQDKEAMLQLLSQLQGPTSLEPIPWHKDFHSRVALDPTLNAGWKAIAP